jgi:hypothetical protein
MVIRGNLEEQGSHCPRTKLRSHQVDHQLDGFDEPVACDDVDEISVGARAKCRSQDQPIVIGYDRNPSVRMPVSEQLPNIPISHLLCKPCLPNRMNIAQ